MTVLFGAADAGKTTFARIVAGLVPRFSGGTLEGTILLDGLDVRKSPPFELMEKVGLVSQDSDEQIFTTRCDTELAFALESLGVPRPQIVERVEESLRRMGLSAFKGRNPSTLSGGEKKRLLLACLFAIGPALWILDESLEELDQAWKAATLDFLAERGRTVLALASRWLPILAGKRLSFRAPLAGPDCLFRGQRRCTRIPATPCRMTASSRAKKGGAIATRLLEVLLKAEGLRFRFPGRDGFSLAIDSLEAARRRALRAPGGQWLGQNDSRKDPLRTPDSLRRRHFAAHGLGVSDRLPRMS